VLKGISTQVDIKRETGEKPVRSRRCKREKLYKTTGNSGKG